MNLAALWDLPVLFCCENNLYAMGTALARSESETDISIKAAAYEMPSWPVDGMDVIAVDRAAARAVEAVRNGGGPHFLELRTYRFRAHSMYDPERYRDKEEVRRWREEDPIEQLAGRLRADGALDDAGLGAIEERVAAEIAEAVAFAEAGTLEPVETLTRHVVSETASGSGR
jgi:pyruvate dehydrogenase E1 component alpha subunit